MASLARFFHGGHGTRATALAPPEPAPLPTWWWYADVFGGVVRRVLARQSPFLATYEVVDGSVYPAIVSKTFLFTSEEEAGREVLASVNRCIRVNEQRRAALLETIPALAGDADAR